MILGQLRIGARATTYAALSRAELKRGGVGARCKVCKGKSVHSADALLYNVCKECGDS